MTTSSLATGTQTVLLLLALLLSWPFHLQAQDSQPQFGHTNDILEVKFDSDATHLISYSAGDGWLCLWEVGTGRLLWRTKTEFIQKANEHYALTGFAFSPDRGLIASGSGNGTVQLWDAKTGRILWRADAHPDSVTAAEFSPDGTTIVSAASPEEGEDEIKVLRVADGHILSKLEGESCTVVAIRLESEQWLRTGCLDGRVSEWDLGTGKQVDSPSPVRHRARRTYAWETSFTSDLKASAMRTGPNELTLKDTQTDSVKRKIGVEGYRIYSRFSADGKKLIVSGYGGFTFYDLTTGQERKIDEFSRTGSTFDLSPDGNLFAEGGSWGNAAIKITETATGKSRLNVSA